MKADSQEEIDNIFLEIDGTEMFDNIGGNTAEVTSMAIAKAAAASLDLPLYKYISLNEYTFLSVVYPPNASGEIAGSA